MTEPTIHLDPVTQTLEGDEFFVGIPVDHEHTPLGDDLTGTHVKCARSVMLGPLFASDTGKPAIGVYVYDHHGEILLSNVVEGIGLPPQLVLNLN